MERGNRNVLKWSALFHVVKLYENDGKCRFKEMCRWDSPLPLAPLSTFFTPQGFPTVQFPVIFVSLLYPPAARYPLAFVLVSSRFFFLSPCFSLWLFVLSQSHGFVLNVCLSIQTDGRNGGLGGVRAYRVEGYTVRPPFRNIPRLLSFFFLSLFAFLNLC